MSAEFALTIPEPEGIPDQELGARVLRLVPNETPETRPYQMSDEELKELRSRCRFPALRDPEVRRKFLEGLAGV